MFATQSNTAFFSRAARHLCAQFTCIFVSCWLCMGPVKTHADTPPGAPVGTHIMLYNVPGAAIDVTAQYHAGDNNGYDGYITQGNGQPAINVHFNYSTGTVYNGTTGSQIGFLQYPAK